MKKIFISIPWFHPAYKAGGPVQSIANMVHELREGYAFYIFCGNTDLDGLALDTIKTDEWRVYNAYTKVWYAGKKNRGGNLLQQLRSLQPDCLYMVGIYSWHFTLQPLFFGKVPVKIVSVRGMLHPGALSEKAIKKKFFLQLLSWIKINKKCRFHVSDFTECEHVKKQLGSDVEIFVAGNFPRKMEPLKLPVKEVGSLRLISIALISPMKNILLVLQALQQCRATILYDLYGPVKEPAYWEQCLEQVKLLPSNIKVQYHKDISPLLVPGKLAHAQVFILPSKSENFGHAIYEALSAGLPVITSKHTPWDGLEAAGAGCNVETDVAGLMEAIDRFALMDNETFLKWNKGAVVYAEEHLDVEGLRVAYSRMFS